MMADDRTLMRLMALSQKGDRDAYRTLLVACQRWLARYFAHRIAPAQVDDLVQDTLVSLHRKRASYDPARPFLPWLAVIARYRWVDQLRRTYRAKEDPLDEVLSCGDEEEEALSARISIDRLLGLIPERQARVIRLVKIDGHSIADAAVQTGQSEPLVKVNIHRGLRKLAALIESDR
jgi:RNA polymerase sigma factor (sigma-70 family)